MRGSHSQATSSGRFKLLLGAALWCLLTGSTSIADVVARPRFDVWTTDTGLPQNSIYMILQTRDGYLWFTTLDGLVRYDGIRFSVFNKGNTKGINSNRFFTLHEDGDGTLWIGTEDGGLTRHRAGKFTTFTIADGLPHLSVRAIRDDPAGGILISTEGGLICWRDGKVFPYIPPAREPAGVFGYRGRSGALWYVDASGLHKIKDKVLTTYTAKDGLASLNIYGIREGEIEGLHGGLHEGRDGTLWMATIDASLYRLKDGVVQECGKWDGYPHAEVIAMHEDREGNLWLATTKGLVHFKDGQYTRLTTAQGLSSNWCKTIYEDREGNLWIGTYDGGLNRLRRQIVSAYSKEHGLLDYNVYPIYEDRAGNVWIGTKDLYRLCNGSFQRQTKIGDSPGKRITAIAEDRAGRLWIGLSGGLRRLEGGKLTRPLGIFNAGAEPAVWTIHEDGRGQFWIGTEKGLYRYSNGAATLYTTKDGLAGDDVKVILESRQGQLWFGTYGGLSRYADGKFASFREQDGLPSNRIRSLYEDRDGTLWIGTYDGGLSRLRDNRFTNYATDEGLYSTGAFQILEDDQGYLWMSSNLGIYRVRRQQLNDFAEGKIQKVNSISFGKKDGLLNAECNGGRQPAGIRARDGKLWFPTQGGVAVIDPAEVPFNPHPPPVVIESFILDRQALDFSQQVEVASGKSNFEIHYSGLSFIKPEHIRFKYKLEGLDADWIEVGTRRTAYYSHLPPGAYTFRVVAANSDGVWNTEGARLQLTIRPPFWRTWWFIAAILFACAALALLADRRRVAKLERAHAAQEAFSRQLIASQERERKRIAAELHDGLGQSLIVIKNRALLGLNAPTKIEQALQQLDEISASASQAISEVREIAHDLRPYQLDEFGLSKAIGFMLKKVSGSSGILFTADIDSLDGTFSKEDETNLYRIVQESVNNIVKHSGASEAKVEITKDARGVQITIRDNGIGFVSDGADANGARKVGLGLTTVSERARMLGGKHTIHSLPEKGTTLTIKIGLRNERNGS